jgi:hypothetical protein
MNIIKKIDDAAKNWNKTKDSKYKDEWYKLIREFYHGRVGECDAYNNSNTRGVIHKRIT